MLFNSAIFVLAFLPIVFLGYYGLRRLKCHCMAKLFLLGASLVFYGYFQWTYLLVLVASIIINYLAHVLLTRDEEAHLSAGRRAIMIVAVVMNLGSIAYFKYFNFFIENINAITKQSLPLLSIALPLGISFFTFQQISFVVDSYYGKAKRYFWLDYSVFVSFFPQLVAGPIVVHGELIPQLSDEKRYGIRADYIVDGIRYFVIGLAKKVLLADRLSLIVTWGYENIAGLSSPEAIWLILAYTLQIYFDFSGYSDMAIGIGKLLGFDLPVNFNEPYKAHNILEFWKRWHITMTRFFTQYLYFPLGGSRKGTARTYVNVMLVFALSGLWHGAGWTFVIWGCLHGLASVFHRICHKGIDRLPRWLTTLVTFGFVNCAWVFFRAENLHTVKLVFAHLLRGGMVGYNAVETSIPMIRVFCGNNLIAFLEHCGAVGNVQTVLLIGFALLATLGMLLLVFKAPSTHALSARKEPGKWEGICLAVLLILCIMTFSSVSEFLYFQF